MRLCSFLLLAGSLAFGQAPKQFEVASVRPVEPNAQAVTVGLHLDGQQARIASFSMRDLIGMAFDVRPDGGVANPRVFLDARPLRAPGLRGGCDGLKVDREGNVWTTGPGGVLVVSREGRLLGRINTFEPTANCAWGDDGSTLYITANYFLVRIRTLTKGAGW